MHTRVGLSYAVFCRTNLHHQQRDVLQPEPPTLGETLPVLLALTHLVDSTALGEGFEGFLHVGKFIFRIVKVI